MIVPFVMRSGRMSGVQAAENKRSHGRLRAQVGRFLERKRWFGKLVNDRMRGVLLSVQATVGMYLFIPDTTHCNPERVLVGASPQSRVRSLI